MFTDQKKCWGGVELEEGKRPKQLEWVKILIGI